MAVTRAGLQTYIANELARLFTDTGLSSVDNAAGIQYPLDLVFEHYGYYSVAPGDTSVDLEDANRKAAWALTRYYVLKRMMNILATFIQTSISDPGASRSDQMIYEHVQELVQQAAEECGDLGVPVAGDGAFALGHLHLDLNSPPDKQLWGHW